MCVNSLGKFLLFAFLKESKQKEDRFHITNSQLNEEIAKLRSAFSEFVFAILSLSNNYKSY